MVEMQNCAEWKAKLDLYLDGELPEQEMRAFAAHLLDCSDCAAAALAKVQLKRAIQNVAEKRFVPSSEFRQRMQQRFTKPKPNLRWAWLFAVASVLLAALIFASTYVHTRDGGTLANRDHAFSEIADLHVATLASSSPVDVVSTDRHTVKPWFQGKIPFAFNLPELQGSEFVLLGGRMAYLEQTPGAHLIYDVRKHHISVFIFQERSLHLTDADAGAAVVQTAPFTMQTWSQNGLRFFVIGDAGSADIENLAKLFKAAA
jgi:anti-sigma factor RsiW